MELIDQRENDWQARVVEAHGLLGGIDINTGKTAKKLESYYPSYSGVLGTAGNLLFMLSAAATAISTRSLVWADNSDADFNSPVADEAVCCIAADAPLSEPEASLIELRTPPIAALKWLMASLMAARRVSSARSRN